MPREETIKVTRGGVSREYLVVYRDDTPERKEAVEFFQAHADSLFPSMGAPSEVEEMPIEEANAYLRQHPIEERWDLLTIDSENPIQDDDLARLRHLPELTQVKIHSDRITDAGVRHLLLLPNLTHLLVYSSKVTDECLSVIRQIRSLVSLDIQASANVSREAALAAVEAMPWLQDAWAPPNPVRLAECQRRSWLSQGDGDEREQAGRSAQAEQPTEEARLRYIDFARRPLARPPAELFEKDDIERLDFIDCGLEVLPEAIGNLTRLRTLYANWGKLVELPDTIGRLVNLEDLWLNNNRLAALPDSFGLLASLKTLALDDNLLERFPEAILELKRLEELRLTGNSIPALPPEIGGLTELRSLSLGRNNLRTLPRGIRRLEKLTYLGLQWNPLESLPEEVWRLPCLITLNLTHTGFTKLPPQAANIPKIFGLPGQRVRS